MRSVNLVLFGSALGCAVGVGIGFGIGRATVPPAVDAVSPRSESRGAEAETPSREPERLPDSDESELVTADRTLEPPPPAAAAAPPPVLLRDPGFARPQGIEIVLEPAPEERGAPFEVICLRIPEGANYRFADLPASSEVVGGDRCMLVEPLHFRTRTSAPGRYLFAVLRADQYATEAVVDHDGGSRTETIHVPSGPDSMLCLRIRDREGSLLRNLSVCVEVRVPSRSESRYLDPALLEDGRVAVWLSGVASEIVLQGREGTVKVTVSSPGFESKEITLRDRRSLQQDLILETAERASLEVEVRSTHSSRLDTTGVNLLERRRTASGRRENGWASVKPLGEDRVTRFSDLPAGNFCLSLWGSVAPGLSLPLTAMELTLGNAEERVVLDLPTLHPFEVQFRDPWLAARLTRMDLDLEGSIQLQPRSSSSTTLQLFGLPVGHYCLTLPRGREEPDPQMTFEVRGPTRLDFRPDAQ